MGKSEQELIATGSVKQMSSIDLASKNVLWLLIMLKRSSCRSERALTAILIVVHCKHLLHFPDTNIASRVTASESGL